MASASRQTQAGRSSRVRTEPATDILAVERIETLAGLFQARVERSPDAEAYRDYCRARGGWSSLTWAQMAAQVMRWQGALHREGLAPGERVAIMLRNCPEWVLLDQAALGLGLVVVPLYTYDRPDNMAYILNHCGARLLLIEGEEQWRALCSTHCEVPELERIVSVQQIADTGGDPRVCHRDAWLAQAPADATLRDNGRGADLATIVYTSGTTGRPKGVMLSHRNILWNARSALDTVTVYPDDMFLSFLPLSHTLERTIGYYLPMMAGAGVAYTRGISLLAEDLSAVRPTVLISVPRIFERVYARIRLQLEAKSGLSRRLFHAAVRAGWEAFEFSQGRRASRPSRLAHGLFDRLVAARIRRRLGGRLRLAVCGGAPLPLEIGRTFIALGVPIVQGYGLTEASPVVSANSLMRNDPASVGRPLKDVRARIGPDGELVVHSPGIMLGYWRDPAASAALIDSQGWLHTGDTARIEGGAIYITGRLKDIIVLSNGEKVPHEDMETAITRDPLFEQALVVGEGRSYLGALVVVDEGRWAQWVRELALDPAPARPLEDPRVQQRVVDRIARLLHDFPGYAQVRRVALFAEPWTVDNGLMTPTMKLRRREILGRFEATVAKLYEGH